MPADTTPRPHHRLPYDRIAQEYNALPVGEVMRLNKVSNITNFKRAMARRGLTEPTDYQAYQRGRLCFLKRWSAKAIATKR